MAGVFLEHPSSLEHDTGSHPEHASRISAIERALSAHDWFGYERVLSPAADRAQLAAVHSESHIDAIERICAQGGGAIDLDTVASPGSCLAARHAAGGAVRLVELLLDATFEVGFSVHRPPGHHATRSRAMGFCLFNSVAVAAQFALDVRGLERVMILDWDVHHGNGTNDIFHSSEQVLFVSIHQSPLYPGTGPAKDLGDGSGRGYTVNLPVPAGSGDETYRSLVDHVAVPLARVFAPQLVLVSAGYDAHAEDPLGGCRVTDAGYAAMTRSVRRAALELGVPIGCVLEGGYALDALARSVAVTMQELVDPDAGTDDPGPITSLSQQARARLGSMWELEAV
jgi:acetoin utilization deacetylase AcuC-like enzyme